MFRYTLGYRFDAKGLSLDGVAPEMKNRFNFIFNDELLSNHLQVRLDEKAIRFFFYDADLKSDDDVVVEEHYKEVASISLTNRKETGYDILYFKKQVETKCHAIGYLEKKNKEIKWKDVCNKITGEAKRGNAFDKFPFVKKWSWKKTQNPEKWFTFFMQCCFLCFVSQLENRGSDFSYSPIYDDVRKKLRDCKVYQLLTAKTKYVLYLFQGENANSDDEYTFKTQQFADLLMDANINKIIPPYYYFDSLWFYDPEIELNLIVRNNYKSRKRKGEARLDEKLRDKIRGYFFRHHSVVSAMGNFWCKLLYWIYIVAIGTFSCCATYCMINFDKTGNAFVTWFFNHILIWDVLGAASLLLLCVLAFNRSINVFMPRIMVALGIGWLTAFVSEDLVKSQLEIGHIFTLYALVGVLLLVIVMLFGEARQHSPYYISSGEGYLHHLKHILAGYTSPWKLIPIIVHSFFWAITLGTVMQFALYDDLLKNSKALTEVVYDDAFENVRTYMVHLENVKEVLSDYEEDWNEALLGKTVSTGYLKANDSTRFDTRQTSQSDYVWLVKRANDKKEKIKGKNEELKKMLANDVKPKDTTLFLIESPVSDSLIARLQHNISRLEDVKNYNSKLANKIIIDQLWDLDSMISLVDNEIWSARTFIAQNDCWDTLIVWSKCKSTTIKTGNCHSYLDYVRYDSKRSHNLYREVKMFWPEGNEHSVDSGSFKWLRRHFMVKHLFPRMLIFHSLIVLIIAFVGQLIISDKSVTEPL